jgi:hypothetical protein
VGGDKLSLPLLSFPATTVLVTDPGYRPERVTGKEVPYLRYLARVMNRKEAFPIRNPYAPPASPTEAQASSGRSCLGYVFVVLATSLGVALVIPRPFLGLAVLGVTHFIDRRIFGAPPFLGSYQPPKPSATERRVS